MVYQLHTKSFSNIETIVVIVAQPRSSSTRLYSLLAHDLRFTTITYNDLLEGSTNNFQHLYYDYYRKLKDVHNISPHLPAEYRWLVARFENIDPFEQYIFSKTNIKNNFELACYKKDYVTDKLLIKINPASPYVIHLLKEKTGKNIIPIFLARKDGSKWLRSVNKLNNALGCKEYTIEILDTHHSTFEKNVRASQFFNNNLFFMEDLVCKDNLGYQEEQMKLIYDVIGIEPNNKVLREATKNDVY